MISSRIRRVKRGAVENLVDHSDCEEVGFTRTERTVLYAGLALMLNALDVDLDESDRLELPTVSR